MSSDQPGFGVYIHWPFCQSKCPYCDFNSHIRHEGFKQADYVAAYRREIEAFAARTPQHRVTSIFFGGGTPSLMAPEIVDAILCDVKRSWSLVEDVEISMEANPTSAEAGRFAAYHSAGVNRLSIGVQSLNDVDLKFLGRLHTANDAIRTIEMGRAIFPGLSFDLIYARPHQTLSEWEGELNRAIDYAADHLSLYQLTIEPGTVFQKLVQIGKLIPASNDHAGALFDATQDLCENRGLPGYEISNHARTGHECRHNLTYWRYQDYVGIGPGAHSRLWINGKRTGFSVEPHPETWLARVRKRGDGICQTEILAPEAAGDEMLLMGLRLKEGVSISRYETLANRPLDEGRLKRLISDKLLEQINEDRICASSRGRLVLDHLIADLVA